MYQHRPDDSDDLEDLQEFEKKLRGLSLSSRIKSWVSGITKGPITKRKLLATTVTVSLIVVVVLFAGALRPGGGDSSPAAPASFDPASVSTVPTNQWVNFFSMESTLDEVLLPVGTVVTAHDPQGVVCGKFTVTTEGRYGLMAVYGDDTSTDDDEGAIPGDPIEFRINGNTVASTMGPDEPLWTEMGDLWQVNLAASSIE